MKKTLILLCIAAAFLIPSLISPVSAAVGGDMGWYTIYCNVDGAGVYFDGTYKGMINGNSLSVGVYTTGTPYSTVTVEKAGYVSASAALPAVRQGETVSVYTTLNAAPSPSPSETGSVYIQTSPAGAKIYINDVYKGISPITVSELRAGTAYKITAEIDGFESASTSVQINSGYTQNAYITLSAPGTLTVESNPTGAYVTVNGKSYGKTPAVVTGLKGGEEYNIAVSLNGYYNWQKRITLYDATQQTVFADLEPISTVNTILVTSNPSGAKIYLDSVYVGETLSGAAFPIHEVADGQHNLKLTLQGYSDYIQTVTMKGAQLSVNANLASQSANAGAISIESIPSGAMIYIDNSYAGFTTPNTITGLSVGEHTVMLRLSGYQDTYTKVMVNAGQTASAALGLQAGPGQTPAPEQKSSPAPLFALFAAVFGAAVIIRK